jgi:hypothetical protein
MLAERATPSQVQPDYPAYLTGFRREGGEAPCPVGFSTWRSGWSPQCRSPMGLVSRYQGARRKLMSEHRRRRATQRSATTPIGPKGCGDMAPSSSLPFLGDEGHRRRRGAQNPDPWRTQRTVLGTPAGPRRARLVLSSTLRRAFGACVSPPPACVRWARLAASLRPHRAVVGGESTPSGESTAGCDASPAAAESW